MRRLRITATMKKRLAQEHDAKGNKRRGGIMLVPRMLTPDEWEQLAVPMQQRLTADVREFVDGPQAQEPAPPPLDAAQEHAYRVHMETMKRQRLPLTEEQRAARAYARAIGLYR